MKRHLEIRSVVTAAAPGRTVRIVRHKNSQVNLSATLKGMLPGQAIQVHTMSDTERIRILSRISSAAGNARIRIKKEQRLNTILVTSLGPWRKRPNGERAALRGRCFQNWKPAPPPSPSPSPSPSEIDIFS
jgi:hypothetical protein